MRKISRLFALLPVLFLLTFGVSPPIEPLEISFGFSFSPSYAEDLGLEPRAAFLEILDSFDFKLVRLPVYWSRVAREEGFDFSEVEDLAREAKARGLTVILSFGYRNFRFPECHAPTEALAKGGADFVTELLTFNQAVLDRFAPTDLVDVWQVENEPFSPIDINCRFLAPAVILEEIAQVREIDRKGRPILLTAGGQAVVLPLLWSVWERVEIVGVSFYPRVLLPPFGNYLEIYRWGILSPRQLARERSFSEGRGKEFWVVEFQAEPWEGDPRTMKPEFFAPNFDLFLSFGGAEKIFFWGPEWWLKEKNAGRPELWEAAQKLINLPR